MKKEKELSKDNENKLFNELTNSFEGVYILLLKGECVYVGESECVPGRIKTHIAQGIKNFDEYRIYYNHNRKQLESDLIKILKPRYNIAENPEKRKNNNLPIAPVYNKYLKDEIDFLVDTIKQIGEPVRINLLYWYRQNIKDRFPTNGYDVFLKVVRDYRAIIGEDEEGNLIGDLRILDNLKLQIQRIMSNSWVAWAEEKQEKKHGNLIVLNAEGNVLEKGSYAIIDKEFISSSEYYTYYNEIIQGSVRTSEIGEA